MKLSGCLLLVVIYSSVFGQENNNLLASLIATEYAFAASAGDLGTNDAFIAYIADDGILFKPNPVNGKEFLLNSGSSSAGNLKWFPVYAAISQNGDLGFTTGPWEYSDNEKESTNNLYGNYCTVWERKTDGDWLFVIDFGIQNEKPNTLPPRLKSNRNYSARPIKNEINKKEDPAELFELDKQLKSDSYVNYLSPDSRFLRDGFFPFIGTADISGYISGNETYCCFKPDGGKISLSKDFGFTYGKYENTNPKKNIKEQFNYVHVWKKEVQQWILLAEVAKKITK